MVFFCLFLKKKALKRFQIFISISFIFFVASCEQKKAVEISSKLFQKAHYKSKKPEQKIRFLDSINSFSEQIKNDSVNRHFLFDISTEYYNQNQFKQSFKVCKQILNFSIAAKDTFSLAKVYFYMGDTYEISQKDSAYYYYQKSEKLYRILKDNDQLAKMLFKKASILFFEGNYIESESQISSSLQYLKRSNDAEILFSAYNLMGCNFEKLDEYDNSLKYFLLAKDLLKKKENFNEELINNYEITSVVNICNIYDKKKQYKKSIQLLGLLLSTNTVSINNIYYANVIGNLGYSKMKNGNFNEVEKYFKNSLSISKKNDSKDNIIYQLINLGEYYSLIKDTTKSINYLTQSLQLAEKIRVGEEIKTALKMLSKIDYRNASKYDKRYIFINDSLSKAQRINRNKYARIEYETSVVEDENKVLSAKNTYIIIGSLLLIFALVSIIVYRYIKSQKREIEFTKAQQKAEEEIFDLLKEYQLKLSIAKELEQNRISKELHDSVMNKLHGARMQLGILNDYNNAEIKEKRLVYVDLLQEIEQDIRTISHDLHTEINETKFDYINLLSNLINLQNEIETTFFTLLIAPEINWDSIESLIKINIFRIVQESLLNISKHANASTCSVTILLESNNLVLEIKDDGVGFDLNAAKQGIGLHNMQERTKTISANLAIVSQPNNGTTIRLKVKIGGL